MSLTKILLQDNKRNLICNTTFLPQKKYIITLVINKVLQFQTLTASYSKWQDNRQLEIYAVLPSFHNNNIALILYYLIAKNKFNMTCCGSAV